jgi:hypothetical protein
VIVISDISELYCLNKALWVEVPERVIRANGNVYVGREFLPDENGKPTYEIKVYVKKIKEGN